MFRRIAIPLAPASGDCTPQSLFQARGEASRYEAQEDEAGAHGSQSLYHCTRLHHGGSNLVGKLQSA